MAQRLPTVRSGRWTGGGPGGSVMTRRGNPALFGVFGQRASEQGAPPRRLPGLGWFGEGNVFTFGPG